MPDAALSPRAAELLRFLQSATAFHIIIAWHDRLLLKELKKAGVLQRRTKKVWRTPSGNELRIEVRHV